MVTNLVTQKTRVQQFGLHPVFYRLYNKVILVTDLVTFHCFYCGHFQH